MGRFSFLMSAVLGVLLITPMAVAQVQRGQGYVGPMTTPAQPAASPAEQPAQAISPSQVAATPVLSEPTSDSELRALYQGPRSDRAPPAFRSRGPVERLSLAGRLGAQISTRSAPMVVTPTPGYIEGRANLSAMIPSWYEPSSNTLGFLSGRGALRITVFGNVGARYIVDCDIGFIGGGSAITVMMTQAGSPSLVRDEPVVDNRVSFLTPTIVADALYVAFTWPEEQARDGFWRFSGCEFVPVESAG